MKNIKEKNKNFRELSNIEAAQFDLKLLEKTLFSRNKLRTYARNPRRYHTDILYNLLDYKSRKEIVENRRLLVKETTPEDDNVPSDDKGDGNTPPADTPPAGDSKDENKTPPVDNPPTGENSGDKTPSKKK